MKRYVIEFAPDWCDGCLSYDTNAASEEEALATVDRLIKEMKGIASFDVTSVDVWEYDDDDDSAHLGCPSYPNCDEAPMGGFKQGNGMAPLGCNPCGLQTTGTRANDSHALCHVGLFNDVRQHVLSADSWIVDAASMPRAVGRSNAGADRFLRAF